MDQRAKKQETRKQQKSCETRDVPYTYRHTNGYLIPNSVYITMNEALLFCSLIPNQALNS